MADKSDAEIRRCFMITPIGGVGSEDRKRADWIYEFVLKEACQEVGLRPERADQMPGSPMIGTRIFEALRNADVCVADLSTLNANVFYEIGVRHTLQKPIIHIAEDGTKLPFDNAQHEAHFYDRSEVSSLQNLRATLVSQLKTALTPEFVVSNPLTTALGTIEVSQSGDTRDQVLVQLAERLDSVERNLRSRGNALGADVGNRISAAEAVRSVISELLSDDKSDVEFSPQSFGRLLDRAAIQMSPTDLQVLVDLLQRPTSFANSNELLAEMSRRYPSLSLTF